jgi:uncharacterized protein (TIGR03435 family)
MRGHMPKTCMAFGWACLAMVASALGQSVSPTPADVRLEAATIKPTGAQPSQPPRAPDLFTRGNITLRQLMIYAYDLPVFRIVGGPAWADNLRFDVAAKMSAPSSPARMRPLVQRVLEDRFALKLHRETRELSTYEMVLARGDRRLGPRLKPSTADCEPFLSGQRPMSESPTVTHDSTRGSTTVPLCALSVSVGGSVRTPRLAGVRMPRIAELIERTLNRVVADKTGLDGTYDMELSFLDDNVPPLFRSGTPEAPALLTAVTEQLGIRLTPSRAPVEVLVIDAATQPSGN